MLLVSINPGAPNGGNGTQYFIGDFDGEKFTTTQAEIKWVDWGTDNYAGVTYNVMPKDYYGDTYSNDPKQDRIFIGWMSNWTYAPDTPTATWRGATTVPRKLTLQKIGDNYSLFNYPIKDFDNLLRGGSKKTLAIEGGAKEIIAFEQLNQSEIRFKTKARGFQLKLSNRLNEQVVLAMKAEVKTFSIDRANSGKVDFQEDFGRRQQMPVPDLPDGEFEVRILIDHSSIEVFINEGQYVMTAQLFPNEKYTDLTLENLGDSEIALAGFQVNEVKRIW